MTGQSLLPISILPSSFASQIDVAWKRLGGQQFIKRLWDKDTTLWTSRPDEAAAIRNRLGWLAILPVMESAAQEIITFAQQVKQDGFTHAILLGMGGSSLFPEVCRSIFGVTPGWLDLTVVDTTDPTAIHHLRQRLPLERTLVIVSSKSGTTVEPNALCRYFYDELRQLHGPSSGTQCVAITDVGTPLEAQALQLGFRRVFAHGPATGQDVGGRFSALTYFGLVPAALIGLDIRQLLSRAREMFEACQPDRALSDNPAVQLGLVLGEGAGQGRDKMTLVRPPGLRSLGAWIEQLIAESTGKSGKGLIPISDEPLRSAPEYGADRLFIDIQLAAQVDRRLDETIRALAEAGHPVVQLRWRDAYDLGGEIVRWFMATAIAASVMRVNPFDEPNVQESKDRTMQLLDRYTRDHALPSDEPLLVNGDLRLYGDRSWLRGDSLHDLLETLLEHVHEDDYVALISFLPCLASLDDQLVVLRHQLAERLGVATVLSHGPRYLHSIGQLYKGGSDRAVLLCFTCDDAVDVPIPGQPYTFGVLKQAQALGDAQALMDRRRRVLRIHLGSHPERELAQVVRVCSMSRRTSSRRRSGFA